MLFDGVDRRQLAELGDLSTPGIADLFIAVMGNQDVDETPGAAR